MGKRGRILVKDGESIDRALKKFKKKFNMEDGLKWIIGVKTSKIIKNNLKY
ncbi:30S ribosomal protein S21 [bacterium]|nr:30S ribosomal protein S21 [bacterium]